jgi:hypothetical protein
MEFLVHMEVGRIEGGEGREKQLREQEAARSRKLAQKGNTAPFMAGAGKARTLGYLESRRLRPTPQRPCLFAAILPWFGGHGSQNCHCRT